MADRRQRVRPRPAQPLLRTGHGDGHAPVGYVELFFDLVFVFAITQLSHFLLEHLTPLGAAQAALLFLAVWWMWMFTTWATNWLDPDRGANRLMLGGVMLGRLVAAAALPQSFSGRGLQFAVAYSTVQVGRSLYSAWATRQANPANSRGMVRIACWFTATAPLWLAGALAESVAGQMAFWAMALAIEYLGTVVRFPVPGMGRAELADWHIAGGHMAERCALFIMIALGEGLLITGATFAGLAGSPVQLSAFLAAFTSSFAIWWVYFDLGARRGAEHIAAHSNPARVGQIAFTWGHIPIIAGIIAMAVADELVLAHPGEPAHAEFLLALTGGMALFLGGTAFFKKVSSANPWYPLSHVVGLYLAAALAIFGFLIHPQTLTMAWLASGSFILIALWEWVSFHGGWIERFEAWGLPFAPALRRYSDRRRAAIHNRRKS